jgi:hypothetical protein
MSILSILLSLELGCHRGVLTGARAAAEGQHDGGEEWRWLELDVRAKEGAKELERERGKRGGEGRGFSSPFIGAEGETGRGSWGGNCGINGFNTNEDGVRLRGVKEGP